MRMRVIRDSGNKPAPEEISNQLSCAFSPAMNKGRNYLDQQGFDKQLYEIATPFRHTLMGGDVIEVVDASLGEVFRARITGWTITTNIAGDGVVDAVQQQKLERSMT